MFRSLPRQVISGGFFCGLSIDTTLLRKPPDRTFTRDEMKPTLGIMDDHVTLVVWQRQWTKVNIRAIPLASDINQHSITMEREHRNIRVRSI